MDDDIARAARAKKESPFLSTEQAAFYLGLSARKLQQMRASGTGPAFRRHSRYVRYHIDDLDAWSRGSGMQERHGDSRPQPARRALGRGVAAGDCRPAAAAQAFCDRCADRMLGGSFLVQFPPALLQILLCFSAGLFGALLVTLVLIVYPKNLVQGEASAHSLERTFLGGLIALCVYIVLLSGAAVLGSGTSKARGPATWRSPALAFSRACFPTGLRAGSRSRRTASSGNSWTPNVQRAGAVPPSVETRTSLLSRSRFVQPE
jgi:hypothetical protein